MNADLFLQLGVGLVESVINNLLKMDKSFAHRSKPLLDKRLVVKLKELSQPICIQISKDGVSILSTDEAADCTIITSLATLRELQDPSHITKLIKQDKLDIEGDIQLAQAFSALIKESNIDWQEELSGFVGDAMAHKIGQGLKQFQQAVSHKLAQGSEIVTELGQDELLVSPHPNEVNQFSESVNKLRKDTDRLSTKIDSVASKVNQ